MLALEAGDKSVTESDQQLSGMQFDDADNHSQGCRRLGDREVDDDLPVAAVAGFSADHND